MSDLRLISFDLCPFVQRSTIALQEKGIPHTIDYIDIKNKPDWFLAISPTGRVPLLQTQGTTLFESTVILEYLDETSEPKLHPADPLQRARDRAWFAIVGPLFGAVHHMMVADDEEALSKAASNVKATFQKLEGEIEGPLWRATGFCAMDAVTYPGLQRARWISELYPELELFDSAPKVNAWEAALHDRKSIKASTVPDIHERFKAYLRSHSELHTKTLG